MIAMKITVTEPISVSFLDGQVILKASCFTDLKKFIGFCILVLAYWQERRDLNPQPRVLETRTLPIELHSFYSYSEAYSIILVTTPAPTVLPPSRIANFKPSFIAIGLIKVTVILASSPGIIISVPSGRVTSPVTSVVLK